MILDIIIYYFIIGAIFLVNLWGWSKGARNKLIKAPYEFQNKYLLQKGVLVPITLAKIILYISSWIFWVIILIGVVKDATKNRK